jgi:MinD-like ATPase involved in chromosome partitioning or flagellar assembly
MSERDRVSVLLAAPAERVRAWYKSLAGNLHIKVLSYSDDPVDLQHKLRTMALEVLILDAELFDGPDELRGMLDAFPGVITFLILPPQAGQAEIEAILSMPSVAGGWTGDISLPEIASEIHKIAIQASGSSASPPLDAPIVSFAAERSAPESAVPASLPPTPLSTGAPLPSLDGSRVVAFWPGPSGGTGCTTLALAFSALTASRGTETILLAFSEPAVSTYLHLSREPNIRAYFTVREQKLQSAVQRIEWRASGSRAGMQVMLGPVRPRDGVIAPEQLSLVIEAACAAYPFVVVDVPSLPPGGNPWAMVPLQHATDIILVMAPILPGISATIEALVTLEELSAAGRTHLVLNQRFPSGALGARDFQAGVEAVWRSCPDVTRVGFVQALPGSMNTGEIPDDDILGDGLNTLGELMGLPALSTLPDKGRKRFSLGDLGKLRITIKD